MAWPSGKVSIDGKANGEALHGSRIRRKSLMRPNKAGHASGGVGERHRICLERRGVWELANVWTDFGVFGSGLPNCSSADSRLRKERQAGGKSRSRDKTMQIIPRIFRSEKTRLGDYPAAESSTGEVSSATWGSGHSAEEITTDFLVHRLSSLLGQLTEEDRQLLLSAAQRLSTNP
jgi:hypothetical protein